MKKLFLMLMGATLIFFSCSKDDYLDPGSMQNDQASTLKKANVKVPFSGIETFVSPGEDGETKVLPNGKTLIMGATVTWLDQTNDELTSGPTEWTMNELWEGVPFASNGKYWGKGKMTINDDRGTWDITFHGNATVVDNNGLPDLLFVAYTTGVGKSGEVKGWVNHTVDSLYLSNFYYTLHGYYIEKK